MPASLLIQPTLNMVLTAAGLGFLGLGARPPLPEWGAMIATGRRYMIDSWWLVTFPGIAILSVSLAYGCCARSSSAAARLPRTWRSYMISTR